MALLQTSLAESFIQTHGALLGHLQKLDEASRARPRVSLTELQTQLDVVWRHLREHFRFEEQDGYMAAVRQPASAPAQDHHRHEIRHLGQAVFGADDDGDIL